MNSPGLFGYIKLVCKALKAPCLDVPIVLSAHTLSVTLTQWLSGRVAHLGST